jgi:hypothetical protein
MLNRPGMAITVTGGLSLTTEFASPDHEFDPLAGHRFDPGCGHDFDPLPEGLKTGKMGYGGIQPASTPSTRHASLRKRVFKADAAPSRERRQNSFHTW